MIARQAPKAAWPVCGIYCQLHTNERTVISIDGPVPLTDLRGHFPKCRRAFSPLRETLGFNASELTPVLVHRMTRTAAKTPSSARAAIVMDESVGIPVSAKTIERIVHDLGQELTERRDADPRSDDALAQRCESPP
jgi:hypothetical protein